MLRRFYLLLRKNYSQFTFRYFPLFRLKRSGAKIGKNIFIGDNVYVELENAKYLEIQDNVVLSAFTKIVLHDSSLNNIDNFQILYGNVIIKNNSYIGINSTILPGSVVGENTILGANSLVKGKLKSNSVYAGVPAKYLYSIKDMKKRWQKISINNRNSGLSILLEKSRWNEK
jgi:acetyltransferase-like isoleucine patch superfamily enzyme